MSNLQLKVGGWEYDHTRALFDGTVKIDGVDAGFERPKIISDTFERMIRHQAYDVSELGLTFYLRTLDLEDPQFIAIPIFPNRHFRHSAIYINTSSGIETPQDLAGKTIGELGTYGHDAGVWPKGILSDDYGVTPDQSRWFIGAPDWYMPPFDFIPFLHPHNVDVTAVAKGKALGPMLEGGEIDALISAVPPRCVLNGSPKVAQLFPDYVSVEREYYARTGIYPIMHTVVVRRDLLAQNPGLARKIYQGYIDSRDVAMGQWEHGRMEHQMNVMVPWMNSLYEENRQLLAEDWWPYGVDGNRKTIDTFLRYSFEQGLAKQRLTCEDIFAQELLDT